MKYKILLIFVPALIFSFFSCSKEKKSSDMNILFLHHSTGEIIWNGSPPSLLNRAIGKVSEKLADAVKKKGQLPRLIENYNSSKGTNYNIDELTFPKAEPYGWNNFPFDYYNIWVVNAGQEPYMEEPTLEMLTDSYQVVIFKHCFPVGYIDADKDSADINSGARTLANYKLQYAALRDKLHEFPQTKFILFTGAALTKASVSEERALRAREFFEWVISEWDQPDDNIYIWDLYDLQTDGGIYFKDEYARSPNDSHPNQSFAEQVVQLLFHRIIDVIENNGNGTLLTGKTKL